MRLFLTFPSSAKTAKLKSRHDSAFLTEFKIFRPHSAESSSSCLIRDKMLLELEYFKIVVKDKSVSWSMFL